MFNITLSGPMHQSELDALIQTEEFNRPFNEYMADVRQMFKKDLSPEDLEQVNQWDECRQPDGFWDTLSETAHNAILGMISYGLG